MKRRARAFFGPKLLETNLEMPLSAVGGKFARQQVMAAAGVEVPRFFCLGASLFREIVHPIEAALTRETAGLRPDDSAGIRQAAATIAALFQELELPTSCSQEILDTFDRHFAAGSLVAVRASMVGTLANESEDSEDNPFAGISESLLYVPRARLIEAVRRAYASGYGEPAILYRMVHGFAPNSFAVAVGVQQMVCASRSFVLFTCNPQTLAKNAIVVAGYGAGEGVVQESVEADHYFCDAAAQTVDARVAHKTECLTFDAGSGMGLARVAVEQERQDARVLSDDELWRLVELGTRIEALFGAPQDIEGAFDELGALHIVQARPIAVAPERYRVWSSANISESFPGHSSVLTYGVARHFYRVLVHDYFRRCGVPLEALRSINDTLERMIGYIDGRIYHCITSFYRANSQYPLFRHYRKDFEQDVAELSTFYHSPLPPAERGSKGVRLALASLRAWLVAAQNNLLLPRRFCAFANWWTTLIRDRQDARRDNEQPLFLLADYQRVWSEVAERWGITLINYQNMIFFNNLVRRLMVRFGLAGDKGLASDLLCGDEQLMGVEIVLSCVRLADQVRADEGLRGLFATEPATELWRALEAEQLPARFTAAVREHLTRYGDRGLQELKMEQPNLRDTPHELLALVKSYVVHGVAVESLQAAERETRASGEKRLSAALRWHPLRRVLLRFALQGLRQSLRLREHGRYFRSELFGYSKRVLLRIGAALAHQGVLADERDVLHLLPEEIFGYLDGSGVTQDLAGLVALRQREHEQLAARQPAREFTSVDVVQSSIPAERAAAANGATVLCGIGSCAGRVRGHARVILDPSLGGELGDDVILIARETDPGWLFLMLAVKGIAVERGSMLSHTAITGRKFGIPTVVNVRDVTRLVPDGAWVEVDGGAGTLTVLSGDAASACDNQGTTP